MNREDTRYLNTDLELVGSCDLTPLVEALARGELCIGHCFQSDDKQSWSAMLETSERFLEPDPNMAKFLSVIEALDAASRSLWDACTSRVFNLGYDCGDHPFAFNQQISAETLGRMAAAGAAIVITLYPAATIEAEQPSSDTLV